MWFVPVWFTCYYVAVLLAVINDCVAVRLLREELQLLQESGSYVGEVVKAMDKKKVLVKVSSVMSFTVIDRLLLMWLLPVIIVLCITVN